MEMLKLLLASQEAAQNTRVFLTMMPAFLFPNQQKLNYSLMKEAVNC